MHSLTGTDNSCLQVKTILLKTLFKGLIPTSRNLTKAVKESHSFWIVVYLENDENDFSLYSDFIPILVTVSVVASSPNSEPAPQLIPHHH